MKTSFEPMSEIQAAFTKVFQKRNWLLGWPMLIAYAVMFPVVFILLGHALGPDFMRQMASGNPAASSNIGNLDIGKVFSAFALICLVGLFVFPLFTGWVLAAAAPVWAEMDPSYGSAFNRAFAKWLPLILFQIVLSVVALVSVITIIGPIIVAVLGSYGPAYIIFGDESPFGGLSASFRLAWRNFGDTLLLILAIVVVSIVFAIPGWILGAIPSIGWVIGLAFRIAAQLLGSAFVALAIVRFYERLRAVPAPSASSS